MLENSQSFTVGAFRNLLFALQYVFSALKSTSDNLNAELILYPYVMTTTNIGQGTGTTSLISNTDDCETAMGRLEYMSYNVSTFQSDDTRSYEALEFLSTGGPAADDVTVSVVTLSYTHSDQVEDTITPNSDEYSLNRIEAAIAEIKKIQPSTRFFAVGVDRGESVDQALYDKELLALSDNIPEHNVKSVVTDSNTIITDYFNGIINLLETGSVLCENQGLWSVTCKKKN